MQQGNTSPSATPSASTGSGGTQFGHTLADGDLVWVFSSDYVVIQYPCDVYADQRWQMPGNGKGIAQLRNFHSQKCVATRWTARRRLPARSGPAVPADAQPGRAVPEPPMSADPPRPA